MRPIDVLVVLPSLAQGGAERVAVNHLAALHRAGERVRLVLTDGTGEEPLRAALDPAIPVTAIGRPRVRDALRTLVALVRRDPPDVILATHTHLNLALCAARTFLPSRTRLVLREPTHAPRLLDGRSTRSRRLAQRVLYRRSDLVLATSTVMEQDLRRLVGDRVVLAANPVDVATIRATVIASPVTRAATGRRFVAVGRLDTQKSLPDLVRAFASGSTSDDELVLIGDGPVRDEVLALARDIGVAERLRLTGHLAAPWPEVAAADAFLLVSRAEGMPNAVLESLAVGTPAIATDELTVLEDVRTDAPDGAVTLVPRERFAEAIGGVRRSDGRDASAPRPSLLPERFDAPVATAALRDLLIRLVLGPQDLRG